MANVQDILTSEEWAQKSPLEKATARKELFALSLGDNPEIKSRFNAADANTQKGIYDAWQKQVDEKYPEAFKTSKEGVDLAIGVVHEKGKPVYDAKTEAIIDALYRPNSQEIFKDATAEQRRALLAVAQDRFGTNTPKWLGSAEDYEPKKSLSQTAIPMALRAAPPIAAGALTRGSPKVTAAFAAAGEAAAEQYEIATGQREKYSPNEVALNALFSMIPAKAIGAIASPAKRFVATTAIRGAEGFAQGAGYEGIRQALEGEEFQGKRILAAGGMGTAFGAAFPIIGAASPKIKAFFVGKPIDQAIADLPAFIEKQADPVIKEEATALQKEIEKSLGMKGEVADATFIGNMEDGQGGVIPLFNDTFGSTVSKQTLEKGGATVPPTPNIPPGQRVNIPLSDLVPSAEKSAGVFSEAMSAPTGKASETELAKREVRASDFDRARIEEAIADIHEKRLAGDESITLAGEKMLPDDTRITVYEMGGKKAYQVDVPGATPEDRPSWSGSLGDAYADGILKKGDIPDELPAGQHRYGDLKQQVGSVDAEIAALPPKQPNPIALSSQAQRMREQYGFVAPSAMAPIGGGAAGAIYGFTTGDTPEDRLARAAEYGLAGVASGAAIGKAAEWYSKPKNRIAMHERVEDSLYSLKKLQEKTGLKISDDSNLLQKLRLMPGALSSTIERKNKFVKQFIGNTVSAAKKSGMDVNEMRTQVNALLQATHAEDFNRVHGPGAAGMSDQEAAIVKDAIANSPQGKDVAELAATLKTFHDGTLDVLLDGQVITPELYGKLKQQYPNHVPFQRILENQDDVGSVIASRNRNVRGTGIIRAKGSDLPVDDIAGNIISNYEQAVIRAAKNKANLAGLRMVRDNQQVFGNLFEEIKPAPIGNDFNGNVIFEQITDPNVLVMRENGKPTYLKINDPVLARAMTGQNMMQLPAYLKWIGAYSRFISMVATKYPSFAIGNGIRDLQEAAAFVSAQKDLGVESAKNVVRNQAWSLDTIKDYMLGKQTADTAIYQKMKDAGGTTGQMSISSREKVGEELEAAFKSKQSIAKDTLQKVLRGLDGFNETIENATRLSIFKEALDKGLTVDAAAALAKEGTIDFNRMGTYGPVMNAVKVFTNASIQGSAKMLRAMAKNPKAAAGVVGTITAAVAAVNAYNDAADPDWRDKVSKWDIANGLPIVLPRYPWQKEGAFNSLVIPVGWGLKPIKVAADYLYQGATHGAEIKDALKGVAVATASAYNPLGGSDIPDALTPTIAQVPVAISRNKSWSGAPIRPQGDKYTPASRLYFDSMGDSMSGRLYIGASRYLSDRHGIEISPADMNYAIGQITGGIGSEVNRVIETGSALAKGEMPSAKNVPFVGKLVRTSTKEELEGRKSVDEEYKVARTEQERQTMDVSHRASANLKKLESIEYHADRLAFVQSLSEEDQDALINKLEKPTGELGKVKSLNVKGGHRAQYIYDKLVHTDSDKRMAYLEEIQDGITPEVEDQLAELLTQKPLPEENPRKRLRMITITPK